MKIKTILFWIISLGGAILLFQFAHWKKHSFPESRNWPTLKVLTYSSFAGVYGPGRVIQSEFEEFCKCRIQWFLSEDSTALLQRFLIIPDIDIVIGWDQITSFVEDMDRWEDLSFLRKQFVKKKFFLKNSKFLPFNWSPIGFIHKKSTRPPPHLKRLYKIKGKISFPEPKTSTLGLEFYYSIYEMFQGDKKQIAQFLRKLQPKVYGPISSWSLSYGFFLKGQTDMGLSYLSSLLYHEKEDQDYVFATWEEGHPYQIEMLSLSKNSKNKGKAFELAKFLLSNRVQKILQNKHYMFPVVKKVSNHKFLNLNIKLISYKRREEFIKQKKDLLDLWAKNLY